MLVDLNDTINFFVNVTNSFFLNWKGLITVLAICIGIILFYFSTGYSRGKRSYVIIAGPPGGGKTVLFHKLISKEFVETVTSMIENYGQASVPYSDHKKQMDVLDIPGEARKSVGILDYVNSTKCILYVIDSSDKSKIKECGQELFDLITNAEVQNTNLPILVVCNKSDLPNSASAQSIKEELEAEIDKHRKVGAWDFDDDESEDSGSDDHHHHHHDHPDPTPFTFATAATNFEFIHTSITKNKITEIEDFIAASFEEKN